MTTDILVEETTNSQKYTKVPRATLVDNLRKRDGRKCMHPDCGAMLDFSVKEGPLEVTIDHWMPQVFGKANGWTMDEIWALSNLKLMHKKCNAKKGDLIPNEDGTLPEKATRTWKNRRAKRVNRPEICTECNAGRDLERGQICAACQHGAAPLRFPRWAKVDSRECDHEMFWCWACSIGIVERPSAESMIYIWGEGGETYE